MRIRRRSAILGTAVAAAAAVAVAFYIPNPFADPAAEIALRPDDPATVSRGAGIYRAHCASCHGAALEGQPNWRERGPDGLLPAPPHDATGHTWHHPDEVLFRITKSGVGNAAGLEGYRTSMPVYAGVLSDDEIIAVLSWIKSRWPADVRASHDRMNARHVASTSTRR